MRGDLLDRRAMLEHVLLLGTLFFLPAHEAPKNIFLWGFLIVWFAARIPNRKSLGPLDQNVLWFELPLIGIILLGVVSSLLSTDPVKSLIDGLDFVSIGLLAIAVRRSTFSRAQLVRLGFAGLMGIAWALVYGRYFRGDPFPSLHSVGHINQVAMYLGVAAAIALGLVWRSPLNYRLVGAPILCLLAWLTIETGSRNTAFGLLLLLLLVSIAALFVDKRKTTSLVLGGFGICAIFAVVLLKPDFYQRQVSHLDQGSLDNARWKIIQTGWEVGLARPLLGYGVGQWSQVTTIESIRSIVKARGEVTFQADRYFHISHGHNTLITWFVERGILAIALLVACFTYALFELLRRLRSAHDNPRAALAFSALLATVLFSVGNTTLHHEHGLLAMAAIALGMTKPKSPERTGVET